MIKITQTTSGVFDAIEDMLDDIPDGTAALYVDTVEESRPFLLDELRATPPKRSYPSDYPLEWTSDRQRKAVMAKLREQDNFPFQRSGALQDAWQVFADIDGAGSATIIVQNTKDYARYVVGSLAQDTVAASRFQQRFHAITGWPLASETVQFWLDTINERFNLLVSEYVEDAGAIISKRRAYTRPRR